MMLTANVCGVFLRRVCDATDGNHSSTRLLQVSGATSAWPKRPVKVERIRTLTLEKSSQSKLQCLGRSCFL